MNQNEYRELTSQEREIREMYERLCVRRMQYLEPALEANKMAAEYAVPKYIKLYPGQVPARDFYLADRTIKPVSIIRTHF